MSERLNVFMLSTGLSFNNCDPNGLLRRKRFQNTEVSEVSAPVGFLPCFQIDLGVVVSLFLLGVSVDGLPVWLREPSSVFWRGSTEFLNRPRRRAGARRGRKRLCQRSRGRFPLANFAQWPALNDGGRFRLVTRQTAPAL